LLDLWDKVKREIIDDMINSEEFLEQVKECTLPFLGQYVWHKMFV